jgi:hypothetical protein
MSLVSEAILAKRKRRSPHEVAPSPRSAAGAMQGAAANTAPFFSIGIRCPKCRSHAARLLELRPSGASEYSCLGCGAVIPPKATVAETIHDKAMAPYRPQNWESEAAKIARLRALRIGRDARKFGAETRPLPGRS